MTRNSPQMQPARRRPIPGMTAPTPPPDPTAEIDRSGNDPMSSSDAATASVPAAEQTPPAGTPERSCRRERSAARPGNRAESHTAADVADPPNPARRRQSARDYTTTRLVNFRIPVDLHDRYRQLVREAEQQHPRLRHPSLTELIIALLEEGPQTASEAAELIRRKRAAEHSAEEPT